MIRGHLRARTGVGAVTELAEEQAQLAGDQLGAEGRDWRRYGMRKCWIWLLLLGTGCSSTADEGCARFQEEIGAAAHYIAWSSYWYGSDEPDEGSLEIYIVRQSDCTHMAVPGLSLGLRLCPGKTQELQAASCNSTVNGIERCLVSGSTWTIRPDDIQTCEIPLDQAAGWKASPDDRTKRRILDAVRDYTVHFAKAEGEVTSVVCGDFNVQDPGAFAIASVRDANGKRMRILFHLTINALISPHCWGAVTHYERDWTDLEKIIAQRIERQPIDLSVLEAEDWQPRVPTPVQ